MQPDKNHQGDTHDSTCTLNRSNWPDVVQDFFRFLESGSLSSRQKKAINAFQVIDQEVRRTLKPSGVTIKDLRQYAVCFDELMFRGLLMERVRIEYWENPPATREGEAGPIQACGEHGQCHAVLIRLRRFPTPQRTDPEAQMRSLLGLLLHEMCHAWIIVFGKYHRLDLAELLEDQGPTGHGPAWAAVMKTSILSCRHFLKLNINEVRYLDEAHEGRDTPMLDDLFHAHRAVGALLPNSYHYQKVDQDDIDGWVRPVSYRKVDQDDIDEWVRAQNPRGTGSELDTRDDWGYMPNRIAMAIAEILRVSHRHASKYSMLVSRGFSLLEALALIQGVPIIEWLTPEKAKLVPEDWKFMDDE